MKTIYIASKTRHAVAWKQLRKQGYNIISTWIDESELGETKDFEDLANRCVKEASMADFLILYCEPGELLKGALLEAGASLGSDRVVIQVGNCKSISPVLANHSNWVVRKTIESALKLCV
jgi:hypothetical protein